MASNYSWVLHEFQNFDSLKLTNLPIPEPTQGQVLVKLECSTINESDIMSIKGLYRGPPTPVTAGLKGTGIVHKSGGGQLSDSLVGKEVAFTTSGTWCEWALVLAEMAYELQESTSFEFATTICYNPLTILNMVDYIQSGNHKAFIHNAAASALGKQLVRYVKTLSIPGIYLVRRQDQVTILQELGAEHVFNTSEPGWFERAKQVSKEINATIGFDAVGGEDTNRMVRLLENGGICYSYGCMSCQDPNFPAVEVVINLKKIEGIFVVPWFHKKSEDERRALIRFIEDNQKIFETEFPNEVNLHGVKDALYLYQEKATNNKFLIRNKVD